MLYIERERNDVLFFFNLLPLEVRDRLSIIDSGKNHIIKIDDISLDMIKKQIPVPKKIKPKRKRKPLNIK